MTTVTIVSLYNPSMDEIEKINHYRPFLDRCILMDDSEERTDSRLLEKMVNDSRVEYVWNEGNIGLCKSLNVGIKKAIALGAEWILVMDSDSDFYNDILSVYARIIASIECDHVALLAPQHNYNRHKRAPKKGVRYRKYTMLSGCLLNVDVIKKIGAFDERFFIDGLDYEWCLRAINNHYKIIECSEAVINHNPAIEKQFKIFGKTIFRYGWDTAERYYYQFRAVLFIHNLYKDLPLYLSMFFKFFKAIVLFGSRREYYQAWKQANIDFERGYYGRYNQ